MHGLSLGMLGMLAWGGVALFPARAAAQTIDTAAIHSAIRNRPPGSSILLVAAPLRVQGKLLSVSDTSAVVRSDSVRDVAYHRITEVWVPRSNVRRGAVTGAVMIGLLGGLFLGGFAEGLCESNCSNAFRDWFVLGGGIGFAGGAVIGAAIGAVSHHWERRWPR